MSFVSKAPLGAPEFSALFDSAVCFEAVHGAPPRKDFGPHLCPFVLQPNLQEVSCMSMYDKCGSRSCTTGCVWFSPAHEDLPELQVRRVQLHCAWVSESDVSTCVT
eukprot:3976659-Amphidinium_carterae.1